MIRRLALIRLSPRGPSRFLRRAIGYAATSMFVVGAGFFIHAPQIHWSDLSLYALLVVPSVPFFLAYARLFAYSDDGPEHTTALYYVWLLALFAAAILLLLYRTGAGRYPSPTLLICLVAYYLCFYAYPKYLLIRGSMRGYLARHQLVWPTLLTIALPLYYSLFLDTLASSYYPLVPVAALTLLLVTTEFLDPTPAHFAFSSLGLAASTLLPILVTARSDPPAHEFLSAFMFSTAVAAYLAVFEAWRITSHVALGEQTRAPHGSAPTDLGHQSNARMYLFTTTAALTVSGTLTPLLYAFTGFGTLFLLGFSLHAFLAFAFWTASNTRDNSRLIAWPWNFWKTLFGFAFLLLLVADSIPVWNHQPSRPLAADLLAPGFVSLILTLFAAPQIYLLFQTVRAALRMPRATMAERAAVLQHLSGPVVFIRAAALISFVMCFIIVVYYAFDKESPLAYKLTYIYLIYGVIIVVTFLANMPNFFSSPGTPPIVVTITGILQTTRILTASIIGLAVLLPLLVAGRPVAATIGAAVVFALAAMAGFALNDYHDADRDRLNKPHRAIPSGRLTATMGLSISLILICTSSLLAVTVARTGADFALYATAIAGVALYTYVVRHLASFKAFYAAALSCIPLVFVLLTMGSPRSHFLLALAAFMFLVGREWLMDILDVPGDALYGHTRTLAMIIRPERLATLALTTQIAATLLIVPLAAESSTQTLALSILLILVTVALAALWWNVRHSAALVVRLHWLPLIVGLAVFIRISFAG